jgi:hypothetical protein
LRPGVRRASRPSPGLRDGALHLDSDGRRGQFTQYFFRPPGERYATLDITCEVRVVENPGRAATISIPFAGLLRVCVPSDFIERHLGYGYLAVVKAVLIGVPMPLCSCGVIPAALGIKKQGASNGAAIGFLISTPQTGVDSIFVSAKFLGLPFALFKVASALVTGLVGGALVHWAEKPAPPAVPAPPVPACAPTSRGNWLVRLLDYSLNELLYMIWVWLVVGIVVSAAITTWSMASISSPKPASRKTSTSSRNSTTAFRRFTTPSARIPRFLTTLRS